MRLEVRIDELEKVAGRHDPPEPQLHAVVGHLVGGIVAGLQQTHILRIDDLVQDGVRHVVEAALAVVLRAALAQLRQGRQILAGAIRGAGYGVGVRGGRDGIEGGQRAGRRAQVGVRALHVVVLQQFDELLGDLRGRLRHLQVAVVLQRRDQHGQTARLAQLVQDLDQSFSNLRLVQHDNFPVLLGEGDVGEGAVYHALVSQVVDDDLLPEFQGVRLHLPVQVGSDSVGHDVVVLGQDLHRNVLVFVDVDHQGGRFGAHYALRLPLQDLDYFLLKLVKLDSIDLQKEIPLTY